MARSRSRSIARALAAFVALVSSSERAVEFANGICSPGQYESGLTCFPCDSTCASCTVLPTNCLSCVTGRYLNFGTCASCDSSCATCSGPGQYACATCAAPKVIGGASQCVECASAGNCPSGKYCSGSWTCASCDAACATCYGPNSNSCSSCALGKYLLSGSCVECANDVDCGSGRKCDQSSHTCYSCDSSCLQCSGPGANQCTSCATGKYLNGGTCASCPNSCVTCYNSGSGSPYCSSCSSGKYLNPSFNCVGCDSSCATCFGYGPNQCLTCGNGTYLAGGTCFACPSSCASCLAGQGISQCSTICAFGQFWDGTSCSTCATSCETCMGASVSACTSCPTGFTLSVTGGSSGGQCILNGATTTEKKKSTSSTLIGIIVGTIVTPGTIFSIMFFFAKPSLRKAMLWCGCVKLADMIVPADAHKAIKKLSLKMSEVEKFMNKQKLPRLKDVTPELQASQVTLHAEDILGTGGYGAVFKGTFEGREVAIKTMFSETSGGVVHMPKAVVDSMRKEAMIMCTLNHPNILHVFGIVPESAWIVMEYCPRGSLSDALQNPDNVFTYRDKLRLATEVATGVAYLHLPDVSIVHGDLKAANVLLAPNGGVRLCDFGLSQAKNRSKTMTIASGPKKGHALTIAWSAPELFKDEPKSFETDVYALGVTTWEIFERNSPFGNMPEAAVVTQVINGTRPALTSSTPGNIQILIKLAWEAAPSSRLTASQLACVLERYGVEETKKDDAKKDVKGKAEDENLDGSANV